MDVTSISNSALLYRSEQTQQSLSTSMMKQAADQQNKVANLLAQNVQQSAKPASNGGGFSFSTYA